MSSPEVGAVTDAVADQVGGDDGDDDDEPADRDRAEAPGGGPSGGGGTGAQQAAADATGAVADALAEDPVEQAAREQAEVLDAERAAHDRAQAQMAQSQAALAQGDAERAEQERAQDAQAAQDLAGQLQARDPAVAPTAVDYSPGALGLDPRADAARDYPFHPGSTEMQRGNMVTGGRPTVEAADDRSSAPAGEPVMAAPSTYEDSTFAQVMSGVNEGIANVVGGPVDLVEMGLNGAMWAAKKAGVPEEWTPEFENSFGSSQSIKAAMGWTGSISPESADPAKQTARDVAEFGFEAGAAMTGAALAARGASAAGAIDDLAVGAGRRVEAAARYPDPPPAGSLDNTAAREWYLAQEARIAERLDASAPLADQAREAFELRNEARTLARQAMEDRALAERLDVTDPNLTWEQLVDKLGARGLEGDQLYEEVINSAQRSRRSVNQRLGLD